MAHGVAAAEFWGLSLADLVAIVRGRVRERTILAWRTAYYHRVKEMPDLADEVDALERPTPAEDGGMSEERHARLRAQFRGYFTRKNAILAGA